MFKYYIGLIWSLAFLGGFFSGQSLVFAADMDIEMLNKRADGEKMVYSVDVAKVDVGDTITWLPTSKGHNVHFISAPDGWKIPKKSKKTSWWFGLKTFIALDPPIQVTNQLAYLLTYQF